MSSTSFLTLAFLEAADQDACLILRVPHSPRHVKSIWSLAVTWIPGIGHTYALFDGAADADIQMLQTCLSSRPCIQSHLLTLPTILVDILSHYRIVSRNNLEHLLYDLEKELGVTRGRAAVIGLEARLLPHEIDAITMKCNQLVISLVYQERGQVFIRDLATRLREELSIQYTSATPLNDDLKLRFSNASHEIEDIAQNCYNLAMNTVHQTSCLEKRAQSLINVVRSMTKICSES